MTLDNVLLLRMKNDVAFIIDGTLNLFEQQSTWIPNMAIRMLEYVTAEISLYISNNYQDKYSSKKIEIPAPVFVVFYNGTEKHKAKDILRLSDNYIDGKKGNLELSVFVYNLNEKEIQNRFKSCKPLNEYIWIIDTIREKQNKYKDLDKSINETFDEIPNTFILKEMLLKERRKVMSMLLTEFDEKAFKKDTYKDGYDDGVISKQKDVATKMLTYGLSNEIISKCTGLSLDKIKNLK